MTPGVGVPAALTEGSRLVSRPLKAKPDKSSGPGPSLSRGSCRTIRASESAWAIHGVSTLNKAVGKHEVGSGRGQRTQPRATTPSPCKENWSMMLRSQHMPPCYVFQVQRKLISCMWVFYQLVCLCPTHCVPGP